MQTDPRLLKPLTPDELAERWATSADHVRDLIAGGCLPGAFSIALPGAKKARWRIPWETVLAYEQGRAKKGRAPRREKKSYPKGFVRFSESFANGN